MNQRSISINQSVSNVSLSIGSSGSVASAQEKIAPSYALESTSLIPGDESDLKDRIVYLEQSLTEAKDKFYQMGYNEGKNDGINEANIMSQNQSKIINETVTKLHAEYENAIEKLAEPMTSLSVKIAEKILMTEISNKDDISTFLNTKVESLVEQLKGSQRLKIYLQPSDMKKISNEIVDELTKKDHRTISFEVNDNLKTGECIIETEDFVLDSTMKNQLDEIEKQLIEGINRSS